MSRYIDVSNLANYRITLDNGVKGVLLPVEKLSDIQAADVIPVEWIHEQIREQNFDTRVLSRMLRAWRAEQNEKNQV